MIEMVVVDTNVVSFLFKQDSRALLYKPHLENKSLIISFMTLAELKQWALRRKWGDAKQKRLENHLYQFTVFHSNDEMCFWWAEGIEQARRNGRVIDTADAWIAATALMHDIPLVTHNSKHFIGIEGLTVISESSP